MSDIDVKRQFWDTLLRAVETEPRDVDSIQGASGFSHPVVALGVDESRRRVVLISGEADARSAALAHGDIQAAMPSVKLLMARPAPINLGQAAHIVSGLIGRVKVGPDELQWYMKGGDDKQQATKEFLDKLSEQVRPFTIGPFAVASVNLVAAWKDIVQQLSLIEVDRATPTQPAAKDNAKFMQQVPTFDFQHLIAYDPVSVDRRLGVCSIPLYEFSDDDVEVFHSAKDIDTARELLKRHDIIQYFFPAADQLALGLVDQNKFSVGDVVQHLEKTPEIGHPFGGLELVDPLTKLKDIVELLQDKGLVVDGELGIEITPDGTSVRSIVKFTPREGLLARLSQVFSMKINFNLKDLF